MARYLYAHWLRSCQLGLAVLACLTSGCLLPNPFCSEQPCNKPPTGPVVKMDTSWENGICNTHDVVNNGKKMPGLVGRLYLTGPSAAAIPLEHHAKHDAKFVGVTPVIVDGSLHVEAFNDCLVSKGGQPIYLGTWEFDSATMKRLACKDAAGWGYSVFLPWPADELRDVKQVHLMLRFTPDSGGTPLFTSTGTMVLDKEERAPIVVRHGMKDINGQPIAGEPIVGQPIAPRTDAQVDVLRLQR